MNNVQPARMAPANSVLLIVDVQEQLAPAIQGIEGIVMRNTLDVGGFCETRPLGPKSALPSNRSSIAH